MADGVRFDLGGGVAVEWELDALMRAADAADPEADPAWRLSGEPNWDELESLRLISGAVGETALAVAVARPAGAGDHGGDGVAIALVGPEGTDSADEALLSTEYDAEGRMRRLGIEVWLEGGAGKRIAADRSGEPVAGSADGVGREATPLAIRFDGERGSGLHELIRPA